MSEDSVTVMIQPEDDTETILGKVRTAGAQKISLIVPPGTKALQTLGGFTMLRKACDITGIDVTVYSTDEKTADMAKVCRFDVVRLETEVRPRETPPPEEDEQRIVVSTRPPEPIQEADAAIAAAVAEEEARGKEPSEIDERLRDLSEEDRALFDALESMSMTEDVELEAEAFATVEPVRLPEIEEPVTPDRPPRREEEPQGPTLLSRVSEPLVSALGNLYIAVVGFVLGFASRFQERRADAVEEVEVVAVAPVERTAEEEETRVAETRRYYIWSLAAVAGFTLLILALFLLSLPRTTVALVPIESQSQEMDLSLRVLMVDEITEENANVTQEDGAISLPARTVQVELSGEASTQTTGAGTRPEGTATGAVILTNRTSYAVLVPAGTQLSGGGSTFHTTQDVTVPASDFVGSDAYIGKAQVAIAADNPGSAGNVETGTITTIEGNVSASLYVVNEMPTSGGSEREGNFVTAADRDRLRQNLLNDLQEEAYAELQRQLGDLDVLSGTLEIATIEETFSHAVDEETDTLVLNARVRASALASSPGLLEQAIEQAVEQELGEQQAGQEVGTIRYSPLVADQPVPGISAWTYRTHVSVPIYQVIDDELKDEVRSALQGLSIEEANEVMEERFGDRIADFAISPVGERLPRTASRIRIIDVSEHF